MSRWIALLAAVWVALALVFNVLVIRGVLGLDTVFEAAVMLMAILPAPFVIPLYLRQGDGEERDQPAAEYRKVEPRGREHRLKYAA